LIRCTFADRPGTHPDRGGRPVGRDPGIGEQCTINFMRNYVNATNRRADARLEGDTRTVVIDGRTVCEVPLAAIEGG